MMAGWTIGDGQQWLMSSVVLCLCLLPLTCAFWVVAMAYHGLSWFVKSHLDASGQESVLAPDRSLSLCLQTLQQPTASLASVLGHNQSRLVYALQQIHAQEAGDGE